MEILIYVLPIWLFFHLTTRHQREELGMYWWVFVIGFGAIGFLYELFRTGRIPPPAG